MGMLESEDSISYITNSIKVILSPNAGFVA